MKDRDVTMVAEKIYNNLLALMNDDDLQFYSNIFNRTETDPDVVVLARQVLEEGRDE